MHASQSLQLGAQKYVTKTKPSNPFAASQSLRRPFAAGYASLCCLQAGATAALTIGGIRWHNYGMTEIHVSPNAFTLPKVYAICRRAGYEPPFVCTPQELMEGQQ